MHSSDFGAVAGPAPRADTYRYDGLQLLRFVAALLVVVTHATFYTHERLDSSFSVWSFGTVGVDIFFVISGFVMVTSTKSLLQTADGWRLFATRRLVRIIPMYWLATTIKLATLIFAPALVLHAALDPGRVLLSYALLPTTNIDGRFEPLLGVGWTLIFEMFFYFVFALALYLRTNALIFVGMVMVGCTVASFFRNSGWPAATMYFSPIVLYFVAGMVMARLMQGEWSTRQRIVVSTILACVFVYLAVFYIEGIEFKGRSATGMVLVCSGVFLMVLSEPILQRRIPSWLLYLGEASYVLYLFHPLVAPAVPQVFARIGFGTPYLSVAGGAVLAVIVSVIIHSKVEVRVTRFLKAKFDLTSGVTTRRLHRDPLNDGISSNRAGT